MQLKIPFSEIPEHGVEYEIKDLSWFPEDLVELAGRVNVCIRLTKKSENRIEVKGILQTRVFLDCDRCLKRYDVSVDSPVQLIVEVPKEGEKWHVHDMEISAAALETISVDAPVVNLAELLRQQLFLSLPEKKLCMEKCSGLCQQCGADLNVGNCTCSSVSGSSPFAVLKKLKKK